MKNDLFAQVDSAISQARGNMQGDSLSAADSEKLWKMKGEIGDKLKELHQASATLNTFLEHHSDSEYS